jgi:hypothetical protein
MRGDSKYRYEFEIYTDIKETKTIPVYKYLSEEERQEFRNMGYFLIPKKLKVSEEQIENVIKKDVLIRRTVPDIRHVSIQQALTPKGRIMKNKFIIEDSTRWYIVKGDYYTFKSYIENLLDSSNISSTIGFTSNIDTNIIPDVEEK